MPHLVIGQLLLKSCFVLWKSRTTLQLYLHSAKSQKQSTSPLQLMQYFWFNSLKWRWNSALQSSLFDLKSAVVVVQRQHHKNSMTVPILNNTKINSPSLLLTSNLKKNRQTNKHIIRKKKCKHFPRVWNITVFFEMRSVNNYSAFNFVNMAVTCNHTYTPRKCKI